MLRRLSPRTRTILGVLIILVITIIALLYAPPEGEANNVTGDLQATPTVVATNQLSALAVKQTVDLGGIHVSIKRAVLPRNFRMIANELERIHCVFLWTRKTQQKKHWDILAILMYIS